MSIIYSSRARNKCAKHPGSQYLRGPQDKCISILPFATMSFHFLPITEQAREDHSDPGSGFKTPFPKDNISYRFRKKFAYKLKFYCLSIQSGLDISSKCMAVCGNLHMCDNGNKSKRHKIRTSWVEILLLPTITVQ